MLKAALAHMQEEFPAVILQQGQAYQANGQVLSIRLSDGLLKARVKGSANQIYNVHIDLKTWPKSPSQCSCTYHSNCKHAVACLLELKLREKIPGGLPFEKPLEPLNRMNLNGSEIIHAEDVDWYSELNEQGHHFFAYTLGIMVNGQTVSIVPLVAEMLKRWDAQTLENLPDHKLMKLPLSQHKVLEIELGRIKPLLRFLLTYYSQPRDHEQLENIRLKQYELILLQEAEQAIAANAARWFGTENLRQRLQLLSSHTSLPAHIPSGLKTSLRDYQQQGINWLQCLRENQFSGILADDMGLGKTVQTLAHLLYEKEHDRLAKPCLIIAPTSLVNNWLEEAKRFAPALKVLVFHGFERRDDQFEQYDIVISTYGLIQRDKQRFLSHHFYYVILDEAQFIKNARTKTTQVIQQLKATHRLCLTGTPLENHLGELWSLFHFLMPGLLGNAKQFRQFFRLPIEKYQDADRQALLAKRVQPFMLRRTKTQVALELPAKTEMTHFIELEGPQRDLYEAIRMSLEKKVRDAIASQGLGRSQIILLDALLKLRQVCCDPRLLSLPDATMAQGYSAKLNALMALLDNLISEGRRVLIFSQFTSMLALIEEELTLRKYPYLILTGQTRDRYDLVQTFQTGSVPVFLISLKAGGTGLNLTRADTVILYDPWWNPAVQEQATGRSHRIGQENPVFVYKLIAAGTVEEAILDMQTKKRRLIDGILNEEQLSHANLSEEDIDQLFTTLT